MSWGYNTSGGGEWSNPGWQGKGAWSDQSYWSSGGKGQWDSGKGSWDEGKGWKGKGGGGGKGVVINIGDSLLQAMYRPPGPMDGPTGQSGAFCGQPTGSSYLPVQAGASAVEETSRKTRLKRSSGSSRRCPSTSSSADSWSSSAERYSRRRRSHSPKAPERPQK